MEYEWDDAKARSNLTKHGLDFTDVVTFDWSAALVEQDRRHAYGEQRLRAYGPLYGRIVVLVFTMRGTTCRVISLRKANSREVTGYEQPI
jgi:uncharacterized DUF497 family protein